MKFNFVLMTPARSTSRRAVEMVPNEVRPDCGCLAGAHGCRLIAVTGGPGAGKTAILELVRKYFCAHVGVIQEAASIVFGGGFPRGADEVIARASQRAIFGVQVQLERIALEQHRVAVALCDRGTLDGLAYWPDSAASYFEELGTTHQRELARYSAVIHLHSPSVSGGYNHQNPVRIESAERAAQLDEKILEAWCHHPRRYVIPASTNFMTKMAQTLDVIRAELPACCQSHSVPAVAA